LWNESVSQYFIENSVLQSYNDLLGIRALKRTGKHARARGVVERLPFVLVSAAIRSGSTQSYTVLSVLIEL
jgi:hypothetical protein